MREYFSRVSDRDIEFLEKVFGSRNVSVEEEELIANSIDAFLGTFHKPEAVVWPEDAEQVGQLLKYANQRKIPVYARGSGTGLSGTVPIHGGIVVNMTKMNKIVEILERDLQVRVQPGIIYERLNKQLEPYGLFFPPDPASGSYCTVGGMVACNASGLKAVKYGTTRDYVLGFQAVFADGSIRRLGTRTFKYSTGYDLVKMMIGSQGTLAIFTEISLRLRTLPEYAQTAVAFFPSIRSATEAIYDVVRRGLDIAAIEFLDKAMLHALSGYKGMELPEAEAMLLFEAHGVESGVKETMNRIISVLKNHEGFNIILAESEEDRERLWNVRRGAYPATLRLAKIAMISDVIVPISMLADAVEKAYEIGRKYGVKVSCMGHFGDGNIHAHWGLDERSEKAVDILHKANAEYVEYALSIGGAVSAEHGIGTEKKMFMKLQHPESYDLLLKIKRLLDPNDILAPGIIFDVEEVLAESVG